ncbi:MAG TPA: GerMN domain-containing protein [Candidatus Nanopelagicaceae bacterium]
MRKSTTATLVGTSAITLLLILSACGTSPTPTPTVTPTATPTSTPTATPTPTPTPTPTAQMRALAQYWVADTARGFRLYREFVRVEITPDPITAALRTLVSSKPKDPDYTNLWSSDTKINSVKVNGNIATVDLTLGKLNVGSEAELLAIAQLVWTATAAQPSVTRISFTVGGKKIESFAGHVDATKPFVRALTYDVLAPVWITSPTEGELKSAQGFTLSGMASTFEANVAWKVYLAGKLVKEGSTLAAEAAPAWKPWSVAIPGLAPGSYLVAAMEFSAKDGSVVSKDTKNVTLK